MPIATDFRGEVYFLLVGCDCVARSTRLTSWVVPFAIGLIIGLLIDLALKVGGSLNWVLVAIPFGAAAITVVGSLVAEIFRQGLQEDADRQRRMELHAESLSENALAWLPSLEFDSDLYQFMPRGVTGLCIRSADSVYSVSSLKRWKYAEQHVLQDPVLGPKWKSLTDHLAERQDARRALERLHTEQVEVGLTREFGPGWVVGDMIGTPWPPRWYNAEVIWNWVRSRRLLGPFTDEKSPIGYGRADIPDETRYNVASGGMTILSCNDDGGPRAEKCRRIVAELQSDVALRKLQDDVEAKDRNLVTEVEEFRGPATEFYERTVESKRLAGICPVCP